MCSWNALDPQLRIAFIQDALPFLGGAERVLEASLEIFPSAKLFTLVYNPERFTGTCFEHWPVQTAFINRLPGKTSRYRGYLPVFPLAIKQFDLSEFHIVLSFSYAVAHGVTTRPDQLHIAYMHRPLRQAWQGYHEFMRGFESRRSPGAFLADRWLQYFRRWDYTAAQRADQILAVSTWIAGAIRRAYHREAQVLHPPVDVERFSPVSRRSNYFILVSRLEAHKRVDLVVEAFSRLGLPLLVIGEGPERERIEAIAGPTIEFLGRVPDKHVQELLNRARAFVCASVEDFGIAVVEAQSAGCPVIAYGKGGVLETVIDGHTGLFYPEQTVSSLISAIRKFMEGGIRFDPAVIQSHAQQFSRQRFQAELRDVVSQQWREMQERQHGYPGGRR